jgi:hypothetical protein
MEGKGTATTRSKTQTDPQPKQPGRSEKRGFTGPFARIRHLDEVWCRFNRSSREGVVQFCFASDPNNLQKKKNRDIISSNFFLCLLLLLLLLSDPIPITNTHFFLLLRPQDRSQVREARTQTQELLLFL